MLVVVGGCARCGAPLVRRAVSAVCRFGVSGGRWCPACVRAALALRAARRFGRVAPGRAPFPAPIPWEFRRCGWCGRRFRVSFDLAAFETHLAACGAGRRAGPQIPQRKGVTK